MAAEPGSAQAGVYVYGIFPPDIELTGEQASGIRPACYGWSAAATWPLWSAKWTWPGRWDP